jgi:hypothetical protein
MMWGIAILHIKQYWEHQLSAIGDRGKSIKNHQYLPEL